MKSFKYQKHEEWIIGNIHPSLFDEEEYRKNERNDEIQRRTFFNVARFASGPFKSWNQPNYHFPGYNTKEEVFNQDKQNSYQPKRDYQPKMLNRKSNTKKSIKEQMFNYMDTTLNGKEWKNKYCGFHHFPETKCNRKKCKRSHRCPRCDGDHTLDKCDKK